MKIQVLCGMVASGKSTYARNAAQRGFISLNDDAIVRLLHADDYTLYDKSLKVFYKAVENQIIATALAMGRSVLVDRGLNVSRAGRRRWLALAKSFDVPCEALEFNNEGPHVHGRRRAEHDPRGHDLTYWLDVAAAHQAVYAPPTVREGFDRVYSISWPEIEAGKVIL
jgi:predicted kinase